MKKLSTRLSAFIFLTYSAVTFGYSTGVSTRDFAQKLPSDNIIVVEEHGNTGTNTQWFRSHDGRLQIYMIDNSVEIRRQLPSLPGVNPGVVSFTSLDRLHDLKVGEASQSYNMRVFFNEDFMWIEVWPTSSDTAPVRNTVMFFGSDKSTYDYYLTNSIPYVKYTYYNNLKKDISDHYAHLYSPDFINLIQYPPKGRKAILSTINSGN
ncbi:hypothetical protein [Pseudomonas turukhanskensis]|uniref:Uncharacterized protein n=1 Tax=Pseudomonas turukhanskensis TaxID=1806536 RepID=A0A9W6NII9_9PSED|nr:hypothetical protein [Pseudomonas turukhanskensis]GLK92248.1 hypothetical protein GCM10017655_53130 [Pseudomonas turukhanskensis]